MKTIIVIPKEFEINNGYLDVRNNRITSLPELPKELIELNCSYNNMVSLPELPSSLKILTCTNNILTSLPELPENLDILLCSDNPLKCVIPEKFLDYQNPNWLDKYYYPYIKSFKGQRYILDNYPEQCSELMKQVKISTKIREEYSHLIKSCELNLL